MLHDRIKAVRLAQKPKLSQSDFGAKIGVSGAAISRLESGDRAITEQNIKSICREFNVNETWLRTGEGEMFQPKSRNDELLDYARRIADGNPGSIQAKILTAMTRLTDAQWEILAQVAEQFFAEYQAQPGREPSIDERVEAYRQELLAEEKGADGSSPSPPAAKNA